MFKKCNLLFKTKKSRLYKPRLFKFDLIEKISPKTFPTNFIKTSKYNLINFLPKSLLLQFLRYANIYFLIIAVLQSIPSISPLNPFTAIAPLLIVLGLSMTREGAEDYDRHRSDKNLNSSFTLAFEESIQKI